MTKNMNYEIREFDRDGWHYIYKYFPATDIFVLVRKYKL